VRKGDFDDGERASRGCTHPGLPEVPWDILPERLVYWMGRPAALSERKNPPPPGMLSDWWEHPPEPLADGCPAGWIISPFAESVLSYVRRRTDGGGRVDNPKFSALADRVAQEAVAYYESQQERLIAHRNKLISERHKD